MSEGQAAYSASILAFPAGSLLARANLAWIQLATANSKEAVAARRELESLPEGGRAVLDAAIDIASDNFGAATAHLDRALSVGLEIEEWDFLGDLLRFFRLADARGYGEKLIAHFEAAGHAGKLAPLYAELLALVRGERHLLNCNPEARGPATKIYQSLVAPLGRAEQGVRTPAKGKRGRSRRRAQPDRRGVARVARRGSAPVARDPAQPRMGTQLVLNAS